MPTRNTHREALANNHKSRWVLAVPVGVRRKSQGPGCSQGQSCSVGERGNSCSLLLLNVSMQSLGILVPDVVEIYF